MSDERGISHSRVILGRYRLLSTLGAGGMGSVWLAQDLLLSRKVALKELVQHQGMPELRQRRERALREARAMAMVEHEAIARIHDVFVIDGNPWIVMEYIKGRSLAEIIKREPPMTEGAVARIGVPVLNGLRAVHSVGIVHRDVKPDNIVVTSERAMLVDFGIAKIAGEMRLTRQHQLLGTADFIAPERLRGAEAGPAADLWSLGVTFFCALEGYSPFLRRGEDGQQATTVAILHDPVPRLLSTGRLANLVMRLLHKDPERRPGVRETADILSALARSPVNRTAELLTHPDPPALTKMLTEADRSAPSRARPAEIPQPAPVAPPAALEPTVSAGPLPRTRLDQLRATLREADTDSAAQLLLAMPQEHAAQVLAGFPSELTGKLVKAMADGNCPAVAGIMQMLSVAGAGRALAYLSPQVAAAVLFAMTVPEATRIIGAADDRTAAGAIATLPSGFAAELIGTMPDSRAVQVLAYIRPSDAAKILRCSDDLQGRLLEQLSPPFRKLVQRHLFVSPA